MRKRIPVNTRNLVRAKFGGHCAYCGNPIGDRWHVDHVIPVAQGGSNEISNLMPSCTSCNNYKMTWSIEQFRKELQTQVERARKYSVNFRLAERFGLARETQSRIIFYFEKFV